MKSRAMRCSALAAPDIADACWGATWLDEMMPHVQALMNVPRKWRFLTGAINGCPHKLSRGALT